jgi:hypothetical protein
MGEAAKISLKAIGKQDTYLLSKDPEESSFNYDDQKRHSEFRKYHRSRLVSNPNKFSRLNLNHKIWVTF